MIESTKTTTTRTYTCEKCGKFFKSTEYPYPKDKCKVHETQCSVNPNTRKPTLYEDIMNHWPRFMRFEISKVTIMNIDMCVESFLSEICTLPYDAITASIKIYHPDGWYILRDMDNVGFKTQVNWFSDSKVVNEYWKRNTSVVVHKDISIHDLKVEFKTKPLGDTLHNLMKHIEKKQEQQQESKPSVKTLFDEAVETLAKYDKTFDDVIGVKAGGFRRQLTTRTFIKMAKDVKLTDEILPHIIEPIILYGIEWNLERNTSFLVNDERWDFSSKIHAPFEDDPEFGSLVVSYGEVPHE